MELVGIDQSRPAKDGPWELPDGWAWMPLGRLGAWTGGGTPSKANASFWENGTVPWVSPKDMKVEIIGETEDKITTEAVASSSAKYVPEGSVLMVMRSGILRHSFPVAVTDRVVTLNQDLRALAPSHGISPHYVARYLALASQRVLHECSKDGTTVNSIEVSALERLRVPVAPLPEQRRIVARIDALFAEIAEGEAALAEARKSLETFRRALLKAAVTGELTKDWRAANAVSETGQDVLARLSKETPKKLSAASRKARRSDFPLFDVTALPGLPESWAWSNLGQIGEIVGGATVDRKRKPATPVIVPYLRVANVQRGYVDLSEVKSITVEQATLEKLRLVRGDILLNEGGDRDKIGRGWVWDGAVPDMIHQNHIFRVRLRTSSLNPFFVSYYANEMGRRFFVSEGKQTTNLASISLSKISLLPIPIPPPAEAAEILRRVSEALAASADALGLLDAEAADAARLRLSILKAAFEGRLVPQDPADEPASVLLARLADAPISSRKVRGGAKARAPATP
ncbi:MULTISPECIES: restriction endonuclease subunit S [unclassified Bradyrhizobium]|uniref:restriction endonuclease subunit S n=1 Tax=unclassified Bradyrhizobium TaxID=2631580 RepID=UPI00211EE520|nr:MULTISPECIES: restriction endonuclease subunit S [unclassified Bradyrhizobium]MDD1536580.1 type I restriction endonuclease subunit S [Bradyrhizobium sp. WBOS8]MDD1586334.1 type I restriction endonuclease subunit S [Bradyrhizobium sp. WBOS4]UUO45952.1 type I restriction endonuclease subunit S [Bradyrhizobium sp. WBOS04]UUO59656.1 type I restriction endonuclease subunit S [Bradyrhizobium sp. WBOS08]